MTRGLNAIEARERHPPALGMPACAVANEFLATAGCEPISAAIFRVNDWHETIGRIDQPTRMGPVTEGFRASRP